MTITAAETPVTPEEPTPTEAPVRKPAPRSTPVQPVLEKLFELYPRLFGGEFLPLKLGVFQELLAGHPDVFTRDSLKSALGVHTRSARYLQSVAAGMQRHDLQGEPVGDVAPEHVHQALMELFRRRQVRSREDLRPKLRQQLIGAFLASGLSRQDYLARVQSNDPQANLPLEDALAEYDQKMAKQDALVRAFESSGKTLAEFADMYGLDEREVSAALARPAIAPTPAAPAGADA
jgi:sRNA-binding protein